MEEIHITYQSTTTTHGGSPGDGNGRKSRKRLWIGIAIAIVFILFFAFFPIVLLDGCMESDDFAMEMLLACPAATDLLGEDIERDWWPGCGSMEIQGNMERTSWMLPVRGSKGSGIIYYSYDGGAGHQSFGGYLEVDGVEIQLGGCSEVGSVLEACRKAHDACKNSDNEAARANCDNLLSADAVTCNRLLSAYTKGNAGASGDETVTAGDAEVGVAEMCAKASKCCMDVQAKKKRKKRDPEKCRALLKNTDPKKCEGALNGYREAAEAYGLTCE